MFKSLTTLFKHSIIYGLGGILSKILGFILIPIYTRYLTPSDYGILSLLLITNSIATIISQSGLGSALFREVIYKEGDTAVVESTALYFVIVESLLFFAFLIFFSPYISTLIFGTDAYSYLLQLIFITGFINVFSMVAIAKIRIHEQSLHYAIVTASNFLITMTLNIYFIVVLKRGVEGLIIAGLISTALFSIVYLCFIIRDLRFTFSFPTLKNMLTFGLPLVPANLSALIMTSSDRYFLKYYSTSEEVGLYSLGYQIALVMNLAVQAVQLAWPAQMFSIAKETNAKNQFATILTYYVLALGFIGLVLSVLAREFLVIMTSPAFYGAYVIVPLIVLSNIFYGIRSMTTVGLQIKNQMKYLAPIIICAAILNLVLNFILIPHYGMMGAAWTTLISYLLLATISTYANLYFFNIPYEYVRIIKIFISIIAIYGCSVFFTTSNTWINLFIKLSLISSFPFVLFLLRFYRYQEISQLILWLKSSNIYSLIKKSNM